LAESVPRARGVDASWFNLEPVNVGRVDADPELQTRYRRYAELGLASVYEWNVNYVQEVICGGGELDRAVFRHLDDIYTYEAPNGANKPSYRFLARSVYPSGLRTNAFGWRGPEIEPQKPAGRIRIAFVGASTTVAAHGDPFSPAEYVGRWLQEWASARADGVSVDVINAGREGIDSSSIAAIVEQEVMPLAPDLVVYYEGANQFWPSNFVVNDLPLRALKSMLPRGSFEQHSALAARAGNVWRAVRGDGRESMKPPVWVNWPDDLDEFDPPLADARLPVQLPAILRDLETIRRTASAAGAQLALASFVWVVHDGLITDPVRDQAVFDHLNDYYWPFSYAHLRRYIDVENRVFRKYATANELPFIDVDRDYPKDPQLFVDAVHMTPAGVKLLGWIMLQHIVPVLDSAIDAGRLPRPAVSAARRRHGEPRLISVDALRASCPRSE
jgi:hypothetical protein